MKIRDSLDGMMISYFLALAIYIFLPQNVKDFYIELGGGIHIHHFVYGIFILAITSYLGLHHDEPDERFLMGLLYGFGLFLTFDEMHMWFRLQEIEKDPLRPIGHILIMSFFLMLWIKRRLKRKLK